MVPYDGSRDGKYRSDEVRIGHTRVLILSNQLTVAAAEEYCRYAFRERKKIEGFWDTTCNEPFRLTQKGEEP